LVDDYLARGSAALASERAIPAVFGVNGADELEQVQPWKDRWPPCSIPGLEAER
jgi:hypothetical protein